MGNHHGASHSHSPTIGISANNHYATNNNKNSTKSDFQGFHTNEHSVAHQSHQYRPNSQHPLFTKNRMLHLRELRNLRRRSVPSDVIHRQLQQQQPQKGEGVFVSNEDGDDEEDEDENNSQKACTSNYIATCKALPSHLMNQSSLHKSNTSLTGSTPRIQINGQDSTDSEHPANKKSTCSALPDHLLKHRAQKTDSRKMTSRKRLLERTAANRRMDFLSFSQNFAARSLDEAGGPAYFSTDLQLEMKPLSIRTRSLSPLKQMRTYSHRSIPSQEESVLTKQHCGVIKKSWKAANERIAAFGTDRCFGFFVLDRIFEKAPALKELFDVAQFFKLADAPEQHPFTRHTRIFNSIIDLSLDNFNEETVRMFCGQIVCTMLDLLGDELTPEGLESWIEMTRYLGTALLSGFEYERLANTKKISINTKQHAYFVL